MSGVEDDELEVNFGSKDEHGVRIEKNRICVHTRH